MSTQGAFGQIMLELGRSKTEASDRIITFSPDVATSTNLTGFLNQRGVYGRQLKSDAAKINNIVSMNKWDISPKGQHVELGIAENNLMLMLAAAGMSAPIFQQRLLPVGTLYDPFISRGLDALNYGCYLDARFMLVATPSGITLAPEGGAHQSISTPLIGMGQPGLQSFEPAFADELQVIMVWYGMMCSSSIKSHAIRANACFPLFLMHSSSPSPNILFRRIMHTLTFPSHIRPTVSGTCSYQKGRVVPFTFASRPET